MPFRLLCWVSALFFGFAVPAQGQVSSSVPIPVVEAPVARLPRSSGSRVAVLRRELPSRTVSEIAPGTFPRHILSPLNAAQLREKRDQRIRERQRQKQSLAHGIVSPDAFEIGVTRALSLAGRDGKWFDTAEGRLWVMEITSPGALMVRAHLTDFRLPPGMKLFVSSSQGSEQQPEVFQDSGPLSNGDFWSPPVLGDTIHLEVLAPASADAPPPTAVPFHVAGLGHFYDDPRSGDFGDPAACEVDAACYPEWDEVGDAVARITFNDAYYIYVCSGVLLNNLSGDFSPLFLTAHHCLSTEALAQTVGAWWFYKDQSCNAGGNAPYMQGSSYATLLATTSSTDLSDATLLQLLGVLPNDVVWASWTTQDPDIGANVVNLHHPHGSYRRIALGNRIADVKAARYSVMWNLGINEPGSSGSPLFNTAQQVVGQLWGGASECSSHGPDEFGKLKVSYPSLVGKNGRKYLEQGLPDDRFDPNHTRATASQLQAPSLEKNLVLKRVVGEDWFRIPVAPKQSLMIAVVSNYQNGEITAELFLGDDPSPLSSMDSLFNNKSRYTNSSDTPVNLYLHVSLKSGVRNTYDLEITLPPAPLIQQGYGPPNADFGSMRCPVQLYGQGWPVTGWYEWGTSPTLASATVTTARVVGGSESGAYMDDLISNLDPLKTYYCRAVASNEGGTVRGQIFSATTRALIAPTYLSPAAGDHPRFIPSNLGFNGEGSSFDFYLGTSPDPPYWGSQDATLYGGSIGFNNRFYYINGALLNSGAHYYWKVVARYKNVSASSVVQDFYTPEVMSATPLTISFYPQLRGTVSPSKTVTIANLMGSSMRFQVTVTGDFVQTSDCWLYTYTGCSINITFKPHIIGPAVGSLSVLSDVAANPIVIPLSGIGYDALNQRSTRRTTGSSSGAVAPPGPITPTRPSRTTVRTTTVKSQARVAVQRRESSETAALDKSEQKDKIRVNTKSRDKTSPAKTSDY